MIITTRLWECALLTALCLCSVATAGDEVKFGKVSDAEWQIGAPADYPEADAVILFSKAHLQIEEEYIVTDCHYRIKILTAAGAARVGNQSIRWHKEYDRIKHFSAQTITPDGQKREVEKNAIFTKEAGEYLEKSFTFSALEPGCIIEYKYEMVNERFWYLNPWYFQTDIYTLKSTFSITVPSGFVYNVLYQNVPLQNQEPRVEERLDLNGNATQGETLKIFTWEQSNLPPITDEPYMSCEYDYRSSLRFQIVSYDYRGFVYNYWESWQKKSEYLEKDFSDYENASGEIKALTEQVTAGLTGAKEKSRAIYNWIVSEFRTVNDYKSRYLGHERMAQFLEARSGTGEEKNLLLVLMHKAAGLEAWPVMISTRDHAKLDPSYPDLRQFNYLIAFLLFGNDFEYVDASSRLTPYGMLPPNCLVDGGLLIDGSKSQLVRVRGTTVFSGRTDKTDMYIASDGPVTCSTQCSFRGYYASNFGGRYESEAPEDFVKKNFLDKLDAQYQLSTFACLLDTTDSFVMTAAYSVEDLVDRLDDNLLVRPVSFAFRENPFESNRRFFPVDFNYPFTYKNVVEVHVADSILAYTLPRDTTISIAGASFAREGRRTDSSAILVTTMIINQPEFLPAAYDQLREFFDHVARASEDEIAAVVAGPVK